MQHHACVRSAACLRIHQIHIAKLDWPLCIKCWSEEDYDEPVWLHSCCPCDHLCGQLRASSDTEDPEQTVPANLRAGI